MEKIENYIKIITYTVILITIIVLAVKILKIKLDKNKNGKIEKEEIESANYDYVMSFLIDTMKVITKGIVNDTGCKVITAEKLIEKAIKNQDNQKIEKEIKEEFENQEKQREQEELDKKLELEMLKKQSLENKIEKEKNKNA